MTYKLMMKGADNYVITNDCQLAIKISEYVYKKLSRSPADSVMSLRHSFIASERGKCGKMCAYYGIVLAPNKN